MKRGKLITGVPLYIQAFKGQGIVDSTTTVTTGFSRTLDSPHKNIVLTLDIGAWNAKNITFTDAIKGGSVFSGTKMGIESVGKGNTGVMVIFADSYVVEAGSHLTYNGTNHSANYSATFSLLLNVNDNIYATANS